MADINQPRSYQFWNAIEATPGTFNLDAGRYGLTLTAAATLQRVFPEAVTVDVLVAADAGYTAIDLPAGVYQLAVEAGPVTGAIELIRPGSR